MMGGRGPRDRAGNTPSSPLPCGKLVSSSIKPCLLCTVRARLGMHRPEGVWLGEAWVVLGLLGPLFSGLSPSEPGDGFHYSALRDHRNEH